MKKLFLLSLVYLGASLLSSAPALAQSDGLTLRAVDKATVRIIGVGGAFATAVASDRTKRTRVVAVPNAGHGTGVVIRADGLILTARHVIEGTDIIAVIRPGTDKAVPARIIYVDSERDLALLQADGEFPDFIRVPTSTSSVSLGDRVSTSGYPIDVSERYPAAASGEVSRLTNSGYLQLSMSVNPGNSGGPVVTASGALLGILIARGDLESGVEGVAIVEPLEYVQRAVQRGTALVSESSARFSSVDASRAHIVTRFVRAEDDGRPIFEKTSPEMLSEVAAAPSTPEEALVLAAYAWNMHVALLEKNSVGAIEELTGASQDHARRLSDIAVLSARDAMARAPYAVRLYPIGRSIAFSNGQSFVMGPSDSATTEAQASGETGGSLSSGTAPVASEMDLPSWSLGASLVMPSGDFADHVSTSLGMSLRKAFGGFGLRAAGVLWSSGDESPSGEEYTHGLLHLGADLRLGNETVWIAGGVGLDVSIIDPDAPVDSGSYGWGFNLEAGVEFPLTDETGLELSFTLHPSYASFYELEGMSGIPDVGYYGLNTALSFH